MNINPKTYRLEEKGSFGKIALIVGIVGLILSLLGLTRNADQFYFSYLTSFTFWMSLGLGGLFFTMLHYVSGAKWSTPIVRISQATMSVLPLMVIFFVPILIGIQNLYDWSQLDIVAENKILQDKTSYLNVPAFTIRGGLYFAVWAILAFFINKYSRQQDSGIDTLKKLRIVSAPGLFLFALTLSFAAFDWIMSLDPMWYSTIFGGYYFGGAFVIILAFLILISNYLKATGAIKHEIGTAQFSDLGKLFFGFIVFWAYLGGAQYFFIWYANIPEETVWFLHRWVGSWKTVSYLLIFGHFLIPFISLIFFSTKRNRSVLIFFALWIFVFHYIDMYWLIAPNLHHEGAHFSWMDLTTFVGIGGIFLALFWRSFSAKAIVPLNDPNLSTAIESH